MGLPPLRRPLARWYLLLISLAYLHVASAASVIQLSQFQEIKGFSTTCTNAYNSPVPGCTLSDFSGNNPCSVTCFSGLQSISKLINTACQGVSADPTTLIGLFFQGKGVAALCPAIISRVPVTTTSTTPASIVVTTKQTTEALMTLTTPVSSPSSSSQQPQTTAPLSSTADTTTSVSMPAMTFTKTAASPTQGTSSMVTANPNFSPIAATATGSTSSTSSSGTQTTSSPNSFGGDVDPFATKNMASNVQSSDWLRVIWATVGISVMGWIT